MKPGLHLKFWMWNQLRHLLYGYNDMQRYKALLLGFGATATDASGKISGIVGQEILRNKLHHPDWFNAAFETMAWSKHEPFWSQSLAKFSDTNATDPDAYLMLDPEGYQGGEIHFFDADNNMLARMPLTSKRSGVAIDGRFDYPYPATNVRVDQYYGRKVMAGDKMKNLTLAGDKMVFNTLAPKLHAIIMRNGQPAWFRIQGNNPKSDMLKPDLGPGASGKRYICIGTVGPLGRGFDIELEDPMLNWIRGNIIRFTKLELEFSNADS